MGFVHLHNHTDFSLLDSAASIPRYMAKAKECGMEALAITDHGNMFGALTFYEACRKNGIKPIIGCEFYMNPKDRRDKSPTTEGNRYYHLILLAMSDKGYHNLMELNSIAYKEGFYYKPRIDNETLSEHSEDLICLSACIAGEIPQALLSGDYARAKERAQWFKDLFGDRYYIELQDHGLPEDKKLLPLLTRLAGELGIPVAATNDIHYIEKEDWNAHDTLLCIGTASKKTDVNRLRYTPEGAYCFKTPEEMEALFSWCPEAITNTQAIADRCDIEIHFPGPVFPECKIPPEFKSEEEYLTHLANEGLRRRYDPVTPELQQRLDYELGIIIQMKFPAYFLIVRDYIYWAKTHGIPVGPGRGSGAGSLVAYSIDITNVDPIKYDLLFERFLNPERVSLPDFDVDFCFEGRSAVIKYVTEHYGADKVGQIVTFGTLKTKAVLKDVARVLDIPYEESTSICSLVPDEAKLTIDKALEMEPRLQEIYSRGGVYKELFDTSRSLEGLNRHTSLHAAGVVIGRESLEHYVPLYADPKTGAISTQYTMTQIEQCGLVKMDFLGLKTLTLIKHTIELIHKHTPGFDIDKIDEHDEKTFEMLRRGDSKCVFQFESGGMANILKREQPHTIEELVALNALYRPGPMQFIDQYIDSKLGLRPIEYPDPCLKDVLEETYGVIVYQEQVMKVAQVIAGYSLGQADILRRIMGKKKKEALAGELVKFKAGAVKNGFSEEHAEEIFHILEPFAGYGFNKSHAVAYSIVAYQTAFLKANYPAEFLAANLTNEMGNPDKFQEYLALAPQYNLKILPPSINRSIKHFNVDNGDIIYGLEGIKGVGEGPVDAIIAERDKNGPYTSFMNFLSRQGEGVVNSKLLEALVKTGVFDELGTDRGILLDNLEDAMRFDKASKESRAYGQLSIFGDEEDSLVGDFNMRITQPLPLSEKLKLEKELLGFYISGHPLDEYQEQIALSVRVDLSQPDLLPLGKECQLIAMVASERVMMTKKKERMAFYTLQTKDGAVDSVCFPKVYQAVRDTIVKDGIYGFVGSFNKRDEATPVSFTIDKVCSPYDLRAESVNMIHIELQDTSLTSDDLNAIARPLRESEGYVPIAFTIQDHPEEELLAGGSFAVDYSASLIEKLRQVEVVSRVWIS